MTPPTLAMQASDNDLTIIHTAQMEQLILAARQSPRKRMILPFHKSDDALLHRMFNAIQPGSYIPPHRHFRSQKAESIILLRGAIAYFTFSEKGEVTGIYHLKAGSPQFGMDTEPTIFHTFIALSPDTLIYEVKSGPYHKATDKDFPVWSPAEDSEQAASYLESLYDLAKEKMS